MQLRLSPQLEAQAIETVDAHTEGEPLRIITGGYPSVPGKTILEKRQYLTEHLDHYRKLLMHEPRGHADMYGCLITEPTTKDAEFGVLFMHNEGYSSMCGHGILAVVQVAAKCGAIAVSKTPRQIGIDSPAGLIRASVWRQADGQVQASFINVASWAESIDCSVQVPGFGEVLYDLGFGGAYYAYVDADKLGIKCTPNNAAQLIDIGRRIKHAVMASHSITHPLEQDLSFLYGTIFTSNHTDNPEHHSRHVCIFADGEVDRSPTGTGVAGRIALLHARGEVGLNQAITIESIVGGRMIVEALEQVDFHGKPSVLPKVSGRSWITGQHRFVLEQDDAFSEGFIFR